MGDPSSPDGRHVLRACDDEADTVEITRFAFAYDAVPDLASQPVDTAPVFVPRPRQPLEAPTTMIRRIVMPPVFVDETGRRRRWLVVAGSTVAAACAAYVAIVGVSVLHGGSGGPVGTALAGLLPEPVVSAPPAASFGSEPIASAQPVVTTRSPVAALIVTPAEPPRTSAAPTPTSTARPARTAGRELLRVASAPSASARATPRSTTPSPSATPPTGETATASSTAPEP